MTKASDGRTPRARSDSQHRRRWRELARPGDMVRVRSGSGDVVGMAGSVVSIDLHGIAEVHFDGGRVAYVHTTRLERL